MSDCACLRVRLFALAGMLQDIASADMARAQLSEDLPFAAGLYRGSSNAWVFISLEQIRLRREVEKCLRILYEAADLHLADPDQEVSGDV